MWKEVVRIMFCIACAVCCFWLAVLAFINQSINQ